MSLPRKTSDLIRLVQNRAGERTSYYEAQELIEQGANIRELINNKPMIDYVIAEEKRHREANSWKAINCQQLIQVLQRHASNLLATIVLERINGGNLDEISRLVSLHANCYQSDRFGTLGLVGELLKQEKNPIRLEIVQFLLENDDEAKFALTKQNSRKQTCLSIAQSNPKCPRDVQQFIQKTFDMILNQIPITHPQLDVNEIIQWIHRGANPETIDQHGNTILLNAVMKNNQQLVEKLINLGCNTEHINTNNQTALQIAENAIARNAQLETMLKAQYINIQLKQLIETKKSQLTFDEVNAILEQGANINTPIANKSTFLHLLIENQGTPEMITTFIETFNADTLAMNIQGYRPIEICILVDQSPYEILQTFFRLSKLSTEIYFNTKLNKTLVQFAQDEHHPEAAELIQNSLNIQLWNLVSQANTKSEHNRSLMPQLRQLIHSGAQINYQYSDNQWTILHLACKTTIKSFVQFLIEELNADYNQPTGNLDYPLSIAAEYGHLSILKYLHSLPDVSLNVANKNKQTPLHLATKNNHLSVVRYLILWGADYQAEDIDKQTPMDMADRKLIHLFQKLICPPEIEVDEKGRKVDVDFDTCELVKPYIVEPIQITSVSEEEALGIMPQGFFKGNPNDNLISGAKEGCLEKVKQAIGNGADICCRKYNQYNAYETAYAEFVNRSRSDPNQYYDEKLSEYQNIIKILQQTAYQRLLRAIDDSIAYRVVAYHQAGSPLPAGLLEYVCEQLDNVQIVDYLIEQSSDIFQAMFEYSSTYSPYHIAKNHGFKKVAAYLKYRLSVACSEAIQENNVDRVRKLIRAGASVDLYESEHIQIALKHKNADLVQLICEYGGKLPMTWLRAENIVLPDNIVQTMDNKLAARINHCLINRRLRLAAANGDLQMVLRCQYLSADINSENYYGSTALFCSIQNGNYFPIVHALVSRGATMLHSNSSESMSLIALAKKRNYTQIADYLSQELNNQFLISILNGDMKSAEKFEQLGADFNYYDEQNRSLLHYAIEHHGIELVTWLCIRGSTPTMTDFNGNYPMSDAAEKGDYAVVEYFANKYPASKQQKTRAGLTALQIAEKNGFKRMAYLLKTGQTPPDSLEDETTEGKGPKYTKIELIHAAKNGNLEVMKEFIDDKYESVDDKRQLCYELITIAEKAKSQEIVKLLRPYHKRLILKELPIDMQKGSVGKLNAHYQEILLGFLTGLGRIIADSDAILDPADPKTYVDLFSSLNTNQKQRSQEIYEISTDNDARQLSEKDLTRINEKLSSISSELNKLQHEKIELANRLQETSEKLKSQEDISAIEREDLCKQREIHKKQLAVYESLIVLYELQQESTLNRQKTVKFFKQNENLYIFFRTIETALQAVFHASLAAQSGYLTTEKRSGYDTAFGFLESFPTSILPFSGIIIGSVKLIIGSVLSKLDEKQQKKEYSNISTLGNIEELGRIASDVAALLTLYYKEQIRSIDMKNKIKGSNIFNEKIHWIKTILNVRPEEEQNRLPIIIVAEYVTAWILMILKGSAQNIHLDEKQPIPQQIWFHVAKENFIDQSRTIPVSDIIGTGAGRQKIPVNVLNGQGEQVSIHIQLRFLLGCVSLVTNDGKVYQYDVSKEKSKEDFEDLELFGYVYVTPFLSGDQTWETIKNERKLIDAQRDINANILTKLKEIEQYLYVYQEQGNQIRESILSAERARQIVNILREQKAFVDAKEVKQILDESQDKTKTTIDILRDDIRDRMTYYQTSIEATNERLLKKLNDAVDLMKEENEKHYTNVFDKLNQLLNQTEQRLESQITQRMNTIEKEFKKDVNQMQKIVETAKTDSVSALTQANDAVTASQKSAQFAEEAREKANKLIESLEQRAQELTKLVTDYEIRVEQITAEQKEICREEARIIRIKLVQEFENAKFAAAQSALSAKESAQAATDSARNVLDVRQDAEQQLAMQMDKFTKMLADANLTKT